MKAITYHSLVNPCGKLKNNNYLLKVIVITTIKKLMTYLNYI